MLWLPRFQSVLPIQLLPRGLTDGDRLHSVANSLKHSDHSLYNSPRNLCHLMDMLHPYMDQHSQYLLFHRKTRLPFFSSPYYKILNLVKQKLMIQYVKTFCQVKCLKKKRNSPKNLKKQSFNGFFAKKKHNNAIASLFLVKNRDRHI